MQRRLDPETGVNKPFENVFLSGAYSEFFLKRGINFGHFFKRSFFSAELILSNINTKNDSRGVRGHAAPENFLKFAYCNGHFSAF